MKRPRFIKTAALGLAGVAAPHIMSAGGFRDVELPIGSRRASRAGDLYQIELRVGATYGQEFFSTEHKACTLTPAQPQAGQQRIMSEATIPGGRAPDAAALVRKNRGIPRLADTRRTLRGVQ